MKVKRIEIKGIRKLTDVVLELDKPMILLFGDTEQGKTTVLDSIKILFSKGFPDDLIQHGLEEASINLTLENGLISRSFYIDKYGVNRGRALNAIVNNKKIGAKELQKMFNPFQLDQDYLKSMTPTERKKEFIDLFGVDTTDLDTQIRSNEKKASDLRIEIKTYGVIDTKEVASQPLRR